MIFSISDFFIRRPVFATVCSIIITMVGAACIFLLPVAQYPEITPPQVTVTSNYIGANASVVESTVTNILERELNGIEGVKYIKSTSANDGTSSISLTFDLERNQDIAAVDVQNRVSSVLSRLPGPVQQTGVRVNKETSGFLLAIGLYADNNQYNDLYLSNYADLYITDALKRIKGVANVQIFGERTYAMRLWLDPNRLASRGLTPQDVVNSLRRQNLQVGAGQIGQQPAPPNQQYQLAVEAIGRFKDANEFAELVIRTGEDGSLIKLKDVGRAELGAENYSSVLRFDGRRGVGLGISQLTGSNALTVAHAVKVAMAELAPSFPPGIKYAVAYDTTLFIEAGAEEVVISLLQAIGLVILIIFLFLQDWRSTLIPSIAIPVALLGTFMFVKLLGFNINTLTLFGLTLGSGLVVDDAIVIVEDVSRRLQEKDINPVEAAIESMNELMGAVIATSLVLIVMFVPVAFFPGTTGQLYKQFALTIAFSVTISTFNAITLTPTISALLLRRSQSHNHWFFRPINWVIEQIRAVYGWLLRIVTKLRYIILVLFVVALGATYWLFTIVPGGFLPQEDQGYFITIVQGPEGTSLNYTEKVLEQAESILRKQPDVMNVFAIGGFSFSGATPNNGLIFTTLKPWEERKRPDQSSQAIIGSLFPQLISIKEATVIPFAPPAIQGLGNFGGFEFQLQDRNNIGFRAMEEVMGQFLGRASTYPGTPNNQAPPQLVGLRPNFNGNTPQLVVEVDRNKANALQVSLEDIFSTLQIFLGSQYVNDFNQFNRSYRVYVQADQQFRSNPEDISKFYVRSATNEMVPLSNIVKVTQTTAPSVISHYNLLRSIEINGSGAPGVSSGQAIQAMQNIAKEVLPRGFGYEWSGLTLEEIQAGGQSVLIFGFGFIVVFLVLAAQYENYIDPFIIMLSVPLAIFGALLAVLSRGFANDVYTQIGLLMLIGMASKNAVLIVEFSNQLREQGVPTIKATIEASQQRMRPILMTALSTIIGTLPLAIATGAGAAARQSLGTAVIGGMCIATVLSLLVVPVLYIVIKNIEDLFRKRTHKPTVTPAKKPTQIPKAQTLLYYRHGKNSDNHDSSNGNGNGFHPQDNSPITQEPRKTDRHNSPEK
ncbi:efflux RND transporter permease subunit [Phormidium sp. LEGE 05292]|uniref:efflux RND transporter permease subunit n=1 Tax=[Phormidium] sp. LEGE 05292 TaxID=767427 RepID=UPI00187E4260|nr:efflux RND transporter permease subunit [Phormidium sp. LEGE 05292]MBE9226758.1 efflux RND transporter permease subunit [Phormidium sp. LEGE 05292]